MSLTHLYRPQGRCADLFPQRADEVLLSGPAGTGKSRACLEKLHAVCLTTPGVRALIVRKTRESLGSTALVTYREHVALESLVYGDVVFYGGSSEKPAQYLYTNTSTITIGGMDKATKIMSSEYDIAYVQEATELDPEDWEAILTRLRNGKISFQQIMADCNPSFPTHWLKMRVDRGDTKMINTRHEDNPTLFKRNGELTKKGESYIGKLDKLTGVRKQRLRHGLWVAAEGMVWSNWNPDIHVVNRFEIPKAWPRYWSVDFGFTNPFVLQCWAKDPDGRLYLYREIYRSKRLVEDHAKDIMKIVCDSNGRWLEPRPLAILGDHDAEGRATFERHTGLHIKAAHKAVTEGLQAVEQRLDVQEDGKPRLFILRNSCVLLDEDLISTRKPTCTTEEIPGYVWDDSQRIGLRETPRKENDHGCDTMRYQVAYHDLQPKPMIRVMT